jgi:ankyrin repeat protein
LHKAAARGFDKVVKYLAENGAELEAKNARGLTPLANAMRLRGRGVGQSAASNESTEELLRSLGATL